MSEVIQSMQNYLSDDNEKYFDENSKPKDIPLDSLEISQDNLKELNDDDDCEIVSLSNYIVNFFNNVYKAFKNI